MATIHSLKPKTEPKRKVLVVEDNLDSVHSMAMLLKSMGHEVQFAINGFAALDFKGDEIARQFKYEPGLENVRIIAITGLSLSDVEQRALHAGCEKVFAKPMDPAVLERLPVEQ
jgi:CheY-like chemotaxis protein